MIWNLHRSAEIHDWCTVAHVAVEAEEEAEHQSETPPKIGMLVVVFRGIELRKLADIERWLAGRRREYMVDRPHCSC